MKRTRLLTTLLIATLLVGGTALSIKFAKGYRPSMKQIALEGTGLLSASSYPKGAQVYVNDKLTTVTDDTVYLEPNTYQIKILKNGFQPWTKSLPISNELVSSADARLFPALPSITPLTFYQVSKALISPDGSKVLYLLTNSPFESDNGLYVFSLSTNLLGSQISQIADLSTYDYSKGEFFWSPDSSQILVTFSTADKINASHILSPRNFNQPKSMVDTTFKLPQIIQEWQTQVIELNNASLRTLPPILSEIATQSATNVYFSPDKEKFIYTASKDLTLPEQLIRANLPSIDSTPQDRNLKAGNVYVFDLKEYTNYHLDGVINTKLHSLITSSDKITPTIIITPTPTKPVKNPKPVAVVATTNLDKLRLIQDQFTPRLSSNVSWYPSNRHLLITNDTGLDIMEYDGQNRTTIVNEMIKDNIAYPSPDGNRVVILSNLNQKPNTYNLFSVDLK